MSRHFHDSSTGSYYPFPTSRDLALSLGLAKWVDLQGCTSCPAPGPKVRYCDDASTCVECLRRSVGLTVELFRQGMPGYPDPFPLDPIEATKLGVGFFYGGDPEQGLLCSRGPHIRKTDVRTRRCLACRDEAARRRARGDDVAKADGRRSLTSALAAEHPDMVISRADALAAGMTQYRTGKACSRGHMGWRHTASGACVECRKEDAGK